MGNHLVVNEDTAYVLNRHEDPTITPEGRLRVDIGTSGTFDTATVQAPGAAFTPLAAFAFNATTAGTLNLTTVGGSTFAFNVPLGFTILPFTVNNFTLGTAVGTAYILS